MLPFDLKLGRVGSNYMRFSRELGKTQVTHPPTHMVADPLLSLSERSHWSAVGDTRDGPMSWVSPCRAGNKRFCSKRRTTAYPGPPLKV